MQRSTVLTGVLLSIDSPAVLDNPVGSLADFILHNLKLISINHLSAVGCSTKYMTHAVFVHYAGVLTVALYIQSTASTVTHCMRTQIGLCSLSNMLRST